MQFFIIFFCSFCIIKKETFQKMINPQKYWLNKIEDLEKKVQTDKVKIHCLRIMIEKEKTILSFNIKETRIKAFAQGEDVSVSLSRIKDEHEKKLHSLKKDLFEKEKICSLRKKDLDKAKEQLQKF